MAIAMTVATGRDEPEMPAEPTQARRFGQARAARSATLVEDYVELIADLHAAHGEARATEVAKRLGVAHPTALKCIARLKREGSSPRGPIAACSSPTPARRWPKRCGRAIG